MKILFFTMILTLLYVPDLFSNTFLTVIPDSSDLNYQEGDQASFMIFLSGAPTNPTLKFFLEASFPKTSSKVTLKKLGSIYYYKTSELEAGTFSFTVKLLLTPGREIIEKAIFNLEVNLREVDGDPVPPNPGEAGNSTLEGIDSDDDGVRDDIEIWINQNIEDGPSTRHASKQSAKYLGLGLVSAVDKPQSILYSNKMLESSACLEWVAGDKRSREITKRIQGNFYNTEIRVRAYLKTLVNYHGQSLPPSLASSSRSDYSSFCEFTPTKETK